MINILIPAGGTSLFFGGYYFPKPLIEIGGKTMIEKVIDNFSDLTDKRFIFVFNHKDCTDFHLDDVGVLLAGRDTQVVVLEGETAGALCSCLMAVNSIENDSELVIANSDQIIDVDYTAAISKFQENDYAGGVITFENIHPRWSYARINGNDVIEVAEKRPISKHAIAGFYYYKKGRYFVEYAQKALLKGKLYDGKYYISASLNEMILDGRRIGYKEIEREQYHTFYSPEKIKEYEDYAGGTHEKSKT